MTFAQIGQVLDDTKRALVTQTNKVLGLIEQAKADQFLWNGMNQLEERDAAGTSRVRYTHGESIVPGVGSVVEAKRINASSTYFQYLHMDHQGSVATVSDANQAKQINYLNDAFGRQIVAPTGSAPNVPNDLVFQSNWITATVGTKRYGISPSRVYDFETGSSVPGCNAFDFFV